MKQTNHTPESLGKEMTAEEKVSLDELIFDIDSFSQNYDGYAYGVPTHDKSTMDAIRDRILQFAQQQTDKLYTKEDMIQSFKDGGEWAQNNFNSAEYRNDAAISYIDKNYPK